MKEMPKKYHNFFYPRPYTMRTYPTKRIFFLLLSLSFMISACVAQPQPQGPGYRIAFDIAKTEEPVLYLGFYYKGRSYVSDTAYQENRTKFIFENDSVRLDPGFYFLLNEGKNLLYEFVIGEDQHFSLTLTETNEAEKTQVQGDTDNKLFFQALRANAQTYEEAQTHMKIFKDSTQSEDIRKSAEEALNTINEELRILREEILETHPESIVSKYILSSRSVEIPESPYKEDSTRAALFQFYYYRDHFFDHTPLNDPLYMRMPPVSSDPPVDRMSKNLDTYLDKLHPQQADSLIKAVDRLAKMSAATEEVFTYLIWLCTVKYQYPKIMGLDKILVHIYDTYYATGRMDSYANPKLKDEIKKVADKRRLSIIGNIAPNLIMQDANFQPQSLYKMKNKYRIVYFFNPDCSSCSVETDKLRKTIQKSPFDIGIFAVCSDTSMVKMKKYIEKKEIQSWTVVNGPRSYSGSYHEKYDAFTTPTVMVIDQKKRLIAKKIPAESIEAFLKNHELIEATKKAEEK